MGTSGKTAKESRVDLLQKQIMVLTAKVDALHQVVEQLNQRIIQAIAEGKITPAKAHLEVVGPSFTAQQGYGNSEESLEHKDILLDRSSSERMKQGDKPLSPEVQIQRLTAQLTAAYNQIASLEERLLAQRVH
jgi:phage I-like protein